MLRLFRQLILRHVRAEVLRTAITVVGVAAGIAVVLAIRLTNASAVRGFQTALDLTSGRAGLEIAGTGFGLDEQVLPQLDWLRAYGVTSPVIDGDILAVVGGGQAAPGSPPRTELLRVLGVDILRDFPVRDYEVGDAGAAPRPQTAADILGLLTDPSAAVITRAFADRHGLEVGDPLRVIVSDRPRDLRVRALLEAEGPARLLDGNFLLMDIAAAQWAFERLGRVDRLDVKLHDGVDIAVAEAAIAARLPVGLVVQRPSRRGQQVEQMLAAFHLNLTALSSIALLVGLFLVYNAVSVSVLARRQEIGTLRALGVTRRQVQALFLGEGAMFGVLGVSLGIPLARLLADATVGLTSATVNTLYVQAGAAPPRLGWVDLSLAVAVGVPLALLAAWLPAREAAAVPPTAVLRGADRALARTARQGGTRVAAVALLVLAGLCSQAPPIAGLPLAGYVASFALVFGAALLMPLVLQSAARHGRATWYRLFGVGGWLAHAALGGAISRVAVSVAALAVSLAMMVAITVMVGSFRQTVVDWVGQSLKADLFVGPASRRSGARAPTISRAVEDVVRAHPEVVAVDAFVTVTMPYGNSLIYLGAGDFALQARVGGLRFKSAVGEDSRRQGRASGPAAAVALEAARGRDAVVVSEPFANRYGVQAGETVTLATPHGPGQFLVTGVYFDYSADRGVVMMDTATMARHFGAQRPTGLTVYLRDGERAAAVRDDLLSRLDGADGVFIYTNRALRAEVLRIFDGTFAITYALQAIAIVVALLGIIGTLMTLVIERRRELGILRAIGASRGQVRAMVIAEAAMLGSISQVAGLALGLLLALILVYVVNLQSFGWTIHLTIPWGALAQMSVLVVITTLLAGLYPAQRAMREPASPQEDE
ncbi:permease [Luteitalea sp. TBR-22]|uniref:ABC transporter permease n=1 Tax=Luteitalea sp. TBR-22 TaxID=2802971 RepID=UPI001AF35BA1|nr:ABC transporter permease [Luteitalea sp. TBR-22]BCS33222.1 permease [Luteitalea sp. TBR-22]